MLGNTTLKRIRAGALIKFVTDPDFYKSGPEYGCDLAYFDNNIYVAKMIKSDVGVVILNTQGPGKKYHIEYFPSKCDVLPKLSIGGMRMPTLAKFTINSDMRATLEAVSSYLSILQVNTIFGEQINGLFNSLLMSNNSEFGGVQLWDSYAITD